MSLTVKLYYFSKKSNSTKIPDPTTAIEYTCILKDDCSKLNPVLKFNFPITNAPSSNYAYIAYFNRYYFIRDWTYSERLWHATLEVDVLASWKASIGASSCYVLRSASAYNGAIMDNMYPCNTWTTLEQVQGVSPWSCDDMEVDGCYIVGVGGQSTTYYMFSYTALNLFFNYLFSDAYALDLVGNWAAVYPGLKAQCNPLQYITSIQWFPRTILGTTVESIRVGWVDVPAAAQEIPKSGIVSGQTVFILRRHTQYSNRGSYLNGAPYSNYSIYFPPFGLIHLDADIVKNSYKIDCLWIADLRTGHATLTIAGTSENGETSHIISQSGAQIGVPYQVSQIVNRAYGVGNLLAPTIGALGSAYSGNAIGAATATVGEIGNAVASKIPSATVRGHNGGIDGLRGLPTMQYEWKILVDEDNARLGRPLCEVRTINTLSGYIIVSNGNIDLASTQTERAQVKNYMEGGFYYE